MIIALMIFEMRNVVIVSGGRGGVRGGLEEREKYPKGKEDKKKKIPMKVVRGCDRISELPKSFEVEVYLNISSHLFFFFFLYC